MDEPVDVVAMGVGEHYLGDVVEPQTGCSDGGRKLLLARHFHARERNVVGRRGLTRVHEPQNSVVLDRPAVDRHRLREGAREEQIQLAARAAAREQEAVLEPHRSGLDCMDLHFARSFVLMGLVARGWVGAKPRKTSSTTPCARRSSIAPPVTSSR